MTKPGNETFLLSNSSLFLCGVLFGHVQVLHLLADMMSVRICEADAKAP